MRQDRCFHSWITDKNLLLSNPPQQRRICDLCGKEDIITLGQLEPATPTYEEVKKRYNKSNGKN